MVKILNPSLCLLALLAITGCRKKVQPSARNKKTPATAQSNKTPADPTYVYSRYDEHLQEFTKQPTANS